jgi:hypothetical protein
MNKNEERGVDIFKEIDGLTLLTSADLEVLAEFQRIMNDKVIPEIVKIIEKRNLLAAKSRHWQIRC